MGYRGTVNCVLQYGENDSCSGELLGDLGKGIQTMFLMMNEARIGIGFGASALGYAGYIRSLSYARERKQGRLSNSKSPGEKQTPIINHPDVKRMLIIQKAYVEGALSLCFYGSFLNDLLWKRDETTLETHLLLDTLTPIIKSWPSEWCLEANKWAIQVHGGYGYTRDYDVEQLYRDNRLNMIHEGTNGIQSLDLLTRKVNQKNGRGYTVLKETIEKSIAEAEDLATVGSQLQTHCHILKDAVNSLTEVTKSLGMSSPEIMISNSHEYLNFMGRIVIAWQWLRMEAAATRQLNKLKSMKLGDGGHCLYDGVLLTSNYFFIHELPKIQQQKELLLSFDTLNTTFPEDNF